MYLENRDVMEVVHVNLSLNDNLWADKHTNCSYNSTENKNNANYGNCKDSKLAIKPLLITQRELFITLKPITQLWQSTIIDNPYT